MAARSLSIFGQAAGFVSTGAGSATTLAVGGAAPVIHVPQPHSRLPPSGTWTCKPQLGHWTERGCSLALMMRGSQDFSDRYGNSIVQRKIPPVRTNSAFSPQLADPGHPGHSPQLLPSADPERIVRGS